MRTSRITPWTAHLPRRLRRRPVGRNHQGPRHANPGTDQGNEPQLYGIQIPPDQKSSMAEGKYFPGPRNFLLCAPDQERYSHTSSTPLTRQQKYYLNTPLSFHR